MIYALLMNDLPEVGLPWQQTYGQTSIEEGYQWAYLAFQAYQPGNPGSELEAGFSVNNDVVLYEVDVSRETLPQPPESRGNIQGIEWKKAAQPHQIGNRSAVWKTTLGELHTPAWWMEFYQGHAYVRISLLGFPDQIAPSILYGLGDIVAGRLPTSNEELLSDQATQAPHIATQAPPATTPIGEATPISAEPTLDSSNLAPNKVLPLTYQAPAGETGMLSFFDESGNQLNDGVTGSDDILEDLGSGEAYEWVGWTEDTDPVTLTFTLEGEPSIGSVEIGFNHREGLGIALPSEVIINGQSFEVPMDEVPNNQRGFVTFEGPFSGPEVEITLVHRERGWILVDEVRFYLSP
jgi:hypothetical protein